MEYEYYRGKMRYGAKLIYRLLYDDGCKNLEFWWSGERKWKPSARIVGHVELEPITKAEAFMEIMCHDR